MKKSKTENKSKKKELTREEKILKECKMWEIIIRRDPKGLTQDLRIYIRRSRQRQTSPWEIDTTQLSLTYKPTNNCQLFSMGDFDRFIEIPLLIRDKVIKAIFHLIATRFSKKLILLDIRSNRLKKCKEFINVFSKFDSKRCFKYKNLTDNFLNILIVKIDINKIKHFEHNTYKKLFHSCKVSDEADFDNNKVKKS